MSAKVAIIVSLVYVLSLAITPFAFTEEKFLYTIGPGDVLEISVWQHPELDKVVTVRPDGKISFSLIGDVNTTGLTPADLDKVITRALSEYVQNPEVTVMVATIKSKEILVLGQVARPGAYPIEENMSILEAIAEAGGYTETASLRKVTVHRKSGDETGRVIEADLKQLMTEDYSGKEVILEPGDVVYVPEKSSAWDIFDRYFVRGLLPVMAFFVMVDELSKP